VGSSLPAGAELSGAERGRVEAQRTFPGGHRASVGEEVKCR
jgi:hypothetical protein